MTGALMRPLRLVFLASRNGSAMRAVHHAISQKKLNAQIVLLASNNPEAQALQFAQEHNIPTGLPLIDELNAAQPDLIVLSGYLRKLPSDMLKALRAPVINTHPSLLPKFGGQGMFGLRVHRAVLDADEKISGATIHLVNEHYDQGKIIAQTRVKVLGDDTPETLAARIISAEAELMIQTLNNIANSGASPKNYITAETQLTKN